MVCTATHAQQHYYQRQCYCACRLWADSERSTAGVGLAAPAGRAAASAAAVTLQWETYSVERPKTLSACSA